VDVSIVRNHRWQSSLLPACTGERHHIKGISMQRRASVVRLLAYGAWNV